MNTERMGMPHVHQMPPPSGLSHTTAASRRCTSESLQMTFFIHGLWAPHTPHVRFAGLLWAEPPGGATYITLSDPGRCFKRPTRTTSPHISGRYLSVATSAHQTSNPNSQLPSGSRTPSSSTAAHHPSWLDTSPLLAQRTRHTIQPALVSAIHTRQRTAEKHISVSPPFSTKTHMGSLPMIGSFEFPHVQESMCTALGMTTRTSVYAQHPQGRLQLLFHCP